MGISVTPEGRDGVWVPDRDSLKAWITEQGFDAIHNFISAGPALIGADHDVESVLADIDRADRVGLLTGDAKKGNLNHALALIFIDNPAGDEHLEMYDIGELTEEHLEATG